jgi:hypothetical protein
MLLALGTLFVLAALSAHGPNPRAAEIGATPQYLPVVLRAGATALPTASPTATSTTTASPTASATPTATASPPATATASATPTATEEIVSACFPVSGTYPIAVNGSYLNADGFVNPDGYYSDETYQNKTWKRMFLQDGSNLNGGFMFLRWRADISSGNMISLTESMTGTGNLGAGFDEAPWPATSDIELPQPATYPLFPHQLNPGDWVYGNSGVSFSASLNATLDWHIANRTLMILPLYDATNGGGSNAYVHTARPGAFLLRGYGSSGGQKYLDLVYIEEPALGSCGG